MSQPKCDCRYRDGVHIRRGCDSSCAVAMAKAVSRVKGGVVMGINLVATSLLDLLLLRRLEPYEAYLFV